MHASVVGEGAAVKFKGKVSRVEGIGGASAMGACPKVVRVGTMAI